MRYQALRFAVGFVLFTVTVPIAFLLSGLLASQMPTASAPVAFYGIGLVWLFGNLVGSYLLTENLSKRWSK